MSKLLYSTPWLALHEEERGAYIAAADGVMCVPLTNEGQVLFIVEPTAYESGGATLYLPSGALEPGEDPAACVNRELQEEAGYRAERLDLLATLRPWVKYLDAQCTIYLARDLMSSKLQGDEEYSIGIEYIPLASFERHIASGRLRDATVIAALFLARKRLAAKRR